MQKWWARTICRRCGKEIQTTKRVQHWKEEYKLEIDVRYIARFFAFPGESVDSVSNEWLEA
jgi:hypothetical protein